ncbi:transcriptional regulator [Klebsiella oxytoca]|nr:transcriptional regulator [Klebsiella oxytoca]
MEQSRCWKQGNSRLVAACAWPCRCCLVASAWPPWLIELAQEHPGLELEMSFSDRGGGNLVEEGFDMAVRNGPLQDSSVLVARKLGEHRMVLCAAPDYLLKKGLPQSVDDLPTIRPLTICKQAECYPGS